MQKTADQAETILPHWLYFTALPEGAILKTAESVADIPAVDLLPWTKAVRVTDIGFDTKPLFLINKSGIYDWNSLNANTLLPAQHRLFSLASAGGLYRIDGSYTVRMHQNSVFSTKQQIKNTHFLLKRTDSSSAYIPTGEPAWLHLPKEAQCTSLQQVNNNWYACFKTDDGKSITFSYFSCNDAAALTKQDAFKYVSKISKEEFRAACNPKSYGLLPLIVKNIADSIDNEYPLYIRLFSRDTAHTKVFLKPASTSGSEEFSSIEAHAVFFKTERQERFAAILLPDGTLFTNSGETGIQKMYLPALPNNFVYTCFFIVDNKIIAAWEEQSFFKVGRSGLFTAYLEELL